MSQKTALILGPGALCGAYGAGAASVLGRHIHFHEVYGCSVGVYAATFLVTEQLDIMLDIWRNYAYGNLLINFTNPLKGKNVLDLEYMVGLFKRENSFLDLDKVSAEKGRLIYVLTHRLSGESEYFHPDGSNVFDGMVASSAVPYVHPAVKINGQYFYDGALSDPYPLQKILDERSDVVVVVSNFCSNDDLRPAFRFLPIAVRSAEKYRNSIKFVEVVSDKNPNVVLLRPSHQILHGRLDRDRGRINETIDKGIEDAEIFLRQFRGTAF